MRVNVKDIVIDIHEYIFFFRLVFSNSLLIVDTHKTFWWYLFSISVVSGTWSPSYGQQELCCRNCTQCFQQEKERNCWTCTTAGDQDHQCKCKAAQWRKWVDKLRQNKTIVPTCVEINALFWHLWLLVLQLHVQGLAISNTCFRAFNSGN